MNRRSPIIKSFLHRSIVAVATISGCGLADSSTSDAAARCEHYFELAQAEDPLAMSLLGDCYAQGSAGVVDHSKAERWYRRSISLAPTADFNAHAKLRLGIFLVFERGAPSDVAEGFEILNELASQGLVGASVAKGLALLKERSDAGNSETGLSLILKASETGDYAANFLLYGLSVTNDPRIPSASKNADLYWGNVHERLVQEGAVEDLCRSRANLREHWMWRATGLSQKAMAKIQNDLSDRLGC